MKSTFPLNKTTLTLIIFSLSIRIFWIVVNSYIGAHIVANASDDVIDSFEEIIADPNMIPTVRRSSAIEYIIKVYSLKTIFLKELISSTLLPSKHHHRCIE